MNDTPIFNALHLARIDRMCETFARDLDNDTLVAAWLEERAS